MVPPQTVCLTVRPWFGGGGFSIDYHCHIKLRKAWLFLDFKNIIKNLNKI